MIADAESSGKKLPEIPEEMIANANAENGASPSTTNGAHRDISMDSGHWALVWFPKKQNRPNSKNPTLARNPGGLSME